MVSPRPRAARAAEPVPEVNDDVVRFVRERLGMIPDEKQAWILSGRHHRLLVNCSRQWGKSTITAAKALLSRQSRNVPFLAK